MPQPILQTDFYTLLDAVVGVTASWTDILIEPGPAVII